LSGRDGHFGDYHLRSVDTAAELQIACRLERREHVEEVRGDSDLGDGFGDLAIADHETDRAAAIVAGDSIHPLTDQLDDQYGFRISREQFLSAALAGGEIEIARRRV